ncbi:hypothetical protein [Chromobacterium sp. IIBBL 290-4]|uniref:hypothetical protein n=1 Tax=Chromobacterium sp. IIBBL 290-4 TaxID=2953890 RepID=UPI0020B6B6DE|nr:hypothetical protein [Chromobacterium sp. IIBBL 290-4]UTH75444.1 hypothetical protein NKT35_04915 [Chromobacterium sp. IIBBL 290-4]
MQELNANEVCMVGGGDRGDATVAGAIAGGTAGASFVRGAAWGARLGAWGGPLGMVGGAILGGGAAYIVYKQALM